MEMILDWRSVGSLIATVMVFRTAMRDFIPPEAEQWLRRLLARLAAAFRAPTATILIDEADGASSGATNDLYDAAQLYLGSRCLAAAPAVRLYKPRQSDRAVASLPDAHTADDTYQGVRVKWTSTARPVERGAGHNPYNVFGSRGGGAGGDHRSLELQFLRQHRHFVHETYIPHVIDEATRMRLKSRERRLYTNRAAAPGDDHHRLWTSHTNSHLRRLLVSTTPKSVVVVEDIDCSLDLSDRKKNSGGADEDNAQLAMLSPAAAAAMAAIGRESISLSGVLNFVDGLWSSCVGERLMIFTTNHPERLDPALLRPGRMDRKIELGYCTPAALRVLAKNYLGVGEDPDDEPDAVVDGLMAEAEGLLAADVRITPADIGEVFMGCDGAGASAALRRLVGELRGRRDTPAADTVQSGALTEEKME